MNPSVRENPDGSSTLMLNSCPTSIVAELLDPTVPFVWVMGHSPNRTVEWWDLTLPVAMGEPPRQLRVRSLWCDLLFRTSEFLECVREFDGIAAYQMDRPVPDSLVIERLPEDRIFEILLRVGLKAFFSQPHSMEVAMYQTWDRTWMDKVVTNSTIAQLLL